MVGRFVQNQTFGKDQGPGTRHQPPGAAGERFKITVWTELKMIDDREYDAVALNAAGVFGWN